MDDDYQAPEIQAEALFHIDHTLHIHLLRQADPGEEQTLQQYTKAKPGNQRVLDAAIILNENIPDSGVEDFEHFLETLSDGQLPDEAHKFFEEMRHRRSALHDCGSARLIHCADGHLATMLARNSTIEKLCKLMNGDTFVVPEKSLAAFRKAVTRLGFPIQ